MVRIVALVASAAVALAAVRKAPLTNGSPFVRHFDVLDYIGQNAEAAEVGAPDQWLETQKLDHLDPANTKVWKQRYFTNAEYYGGPGSPVFLYINGEYRARNTSVTNKDLHINVLAKKHKALLVALEHRYYGFSQPVPDYTAPNIKYLTSEQALHDILYFQDHITKTHNLTQSKWVAFGCSYPGMLSAWSRLKHGDRFVGSVASSAPIETKVNFFEYADKVEYGLRRVGGDKCVNAVEKGLVAFHNVVASTQPADVAELNRLFKPCKPFTDDFDRGVLEARIYYPFEGVLQSNDYSDWNLAAVCDFFTTSTKTPLETIAEWAIDDNPATCTNVDFQNSWIAYYNNRNISTSDMTVAWGYQTCNEFGFAQNSAWSTSIFKVLSFLDEKVALTEICKRSYGITDVDARTAATRRTYGGVKIDVTNVIFPTGNFDGWAALAPSNETGVVNALSEVVDMDGKSHCGDQGAPKATDSPALAWGKQKVAAAVDRFLRDQC